MGKKILLAFVCAALTWPLVCADEAAEDAEQTGGGWSFSQSAAGQVNPLGLTLDTRVFYTWPLYPEKRGLLWDTCRVEAGLANSLTPAFDTVSVFVRVEPIAFFDLAASAGLRAYSDALGYGFTPRADYEDSWDARSRKDAEKSSALGFRYNLAATLKGAAGPFVFGSATSYTLYDMRSTPGGADYYYDPSADTTLKLLDGFIVNDSLVLYTCAEAPQVRAGLLHTFLYVPGSRYTSRRLCLVGRIEGQLSPSIKAFAALLGGTFLRNRYYSWKDGKVYAAVQLGITADL